MAEKKEVKDGAVKKNSVNFFVYLIIGLIIITFVMGSGELLGFSDFFAEITKKVEHNSDGTLSIEKLAQTPANQGNPNAYIGKVLGKKIQFGRDDDFNRRYDSIINNQNFNGYQKYQYIRMIFENEIEKNIGMYSAQNMGIRVSNDNVLRIIARRSYTNEAGQINYDALRRDLNKINQGHSEEVRAELLLENFEYDYFSNLPVGYDEVKYQFQSDNTTVRVKYVDVRFDDIPMETLEQYAKVNDEKFKKYQISKIIFSESNKKAAEDALISVINNPAAFNETAENLRAENKIINVLHNSDYYFLNNYDPQIAAVLRDTKIGDVANKIIKEENIGYVIVKLQDVRSARLSDQDSYNYISGEYARENRALVEMDAKKKADDLYNAAGTVSIDRAALSAGLTVESPDNEYRVGDNIFPFMDYDKSSDLAFMMSIFNKNKGDKVSPYRYDEGFVIVYIDDKTEADMSLLSSQYEQIEKRISSDKSSQLKYDFYAAKKKEYKVVDNFNYVFRIQDFLR